jgi:hypothetical protein
VEVIGAAQTKKTRPRTSRRPVGEGDAKSAIEHLFWDKKDYSLNTHPVTNLREERSKYTQEIPKNLIYYKRIWCTKARRRTGEQGRGNRAGIRGTLKQQSCCVRALRNKARNRAGAMEVHNWR